MNRITWETIVNFTNVNKYPILPCPYCKETNLEIDKSSITYRKVTCEDTSSLIQEDIRSQVATVATIAEKNILLGAILGFGAIATYKGKEPAKFLSFFSCNNCGEHVTATGTAQLVEKNNQENTNSSLIKVEYFSPPIPVFAISPNVPIAIQREVLQSFNHFHSDLSSSGAKLRRSIERMCSELGFKEKNLHSSISSMEKEFPREAKLFNSLKLIGNEATHGYTVNEEDLLDAFEVQDFVLGLFDRIKEEREIEEKSRKLEEKFKTKHPQQIKKLVNKKVE